MATPRIFVSHSSHDNDFGVRLVEDLRRVLGDDAVWYDAHGGLHGGDTWWRKIVEEVKARNVFIVVLSPAAQVSSWVNSEIDMAWRQMHLPAGKLIIPVLYQPCEIRDDLATLQIVSFLPPKTYREAFSELLLAVESSSKSKTRDELNQSDTTEAVPQAKIFPSLPRQNQFKMPDLPPRTREPMAPGPSTYSQGDITSVPQQEQQMAEPVLKMPPSSLWKQVLVGALFLLEGALFLRFLFKLIGADPTNLFVGFLYALTDIVLFPFANIVHSPSIHPPYQAFEWNTLIAMAIYWLLLWVLPRFIAHSASW